MKISTGRPSGPNASDGGLAAVAREFADKFGLDVVNLGMQLASFTILAVVLYKFAIKPVLATMDQRTSKIESGLKFAEDLYLPWGRLAETVRTGRPAMALSQAVATPACRNGESSGRSW